MAKAGNLKLNFVAKSIGIHFFGFEDIFRCYRDNENLKIHFGRMDTLIKTLNSLDKSEELKFMEKLYNDDVKGALSRYLATL